MLRAVLVGMLREHDRWLLAIQLREGDYRRRRLEAASPTPIGGHIDWFGCQERRGTPLPRRSWTGRCQPVNLQTPPLAGVPHVRQQASRIERAGYRLRDPVRRVSDLDVRVGGLRQLT
jgi:hypothetical protein